MKISIKLFVISLTIFFSQSVFAEKNNNAQQFIEAKRLLENDPEGSYVLLKKVKRFSFADDVRLRLLADAAMRTQRVQESCDVLLAFSKKTPSSNDAIRALIERVELLMLIGQVDEARKAVKGVIKKLRISNWKRANRWHFTARALRLSHDLTEEGSRKAVAKKLLIYYPTEPPTRREGLAISVEDLSNYERFVRADRLMDGWAYEEAREEYKILKKIKKYKDTSLWNLGVIGLRKLRDQPKEAEVIFKDLAQRKNVYRERSMWYWARSLMKQNLYDQAFNVFDLYEKTFPSGTNVSAIYYYRGWLPYDARDNKKAIKGLNAFIKKYGKRGRKASFIYGFLGWAHMREKQWDKAIAVWNDMQSFGNSLIAGKALYWKAVAQNEKGQPDKARKTLDRIRARYALTYYGMLAEQLRNKLDGKDTKASSLWWPERESVIKDSPRINAKKYTFSDTSAATQKEWKRVKELVELEEKQLARATLKPIQKTLLGTISASKKKDFIHSLGWFVEDFNSMWRAAAGSISAMPRFPVRNKRNMVMAYPRAYKDVVQNVSDEFNISDYFMWSIMRQESRYKPSAISYTDAVGALQMIPRTARKVAPNIGTEYKLHTFSDPKVGFRFSAYYLRKILDYFGGLHVPAAAAYNTGPAVISRWFHKNDKLEFASLIEEFEYNEGRGYCRKVIEHMLRYIYLYEEDDEKRKALLDTMFPTSRDVDVPLPADIDY